MSVNDVLREALLYKGLGADLANECYGDSSMAIEVTEGFNIAVTVLPLYINISTRFAVSEHKLEGANPRFNALIVKPVSTKLLSSGYFYVDSGEVFFSVVASPNSSASELGDILNDFYNVAREMVNLVNT